MKHQISIQRRAHWALILSLLLVAACGPVAAPAIVPTPKVTELPPTALVADVPTTSPTSVTVTVPVTVTNPSMLGMDMSTEPTIVTVTQANTPAATAVATVGPTPTDFVIDWILFGTPTVTPSRPGDPAANPQHIDTPVATANAAPVTNPTSDPPSPTVIRTATRLATSSANGAAASGTGDPKRGQSLFAGVASCNACHDVATGNTIVGPSLKGVASRAGSRRPGMSASEYIHTHIVAPGEFTVPGFPAGVMPQTFSQTLSTQQINDIVAYLLTLK